MRERDRTTARRRIALGFLLLCAAAIVDLAVANAFLLWQGDSRHWVVQGAPRPGSWMLEAPGDWPPWVGTDGTEWRYQQFYSFNEYPNNRNDPKPWRIPEDAPILLSWHRQSRAGLTATYQGLDTSYHDADKSIAYSDSDMVYTFRSNGHQYYIARYDAGWPFRSWTVAAMSSQAAMQESRRVIGGIDAPAWLAPDTWMPHPMAFTPVWTGLILNASLYAIVFAALFSSLRLPLRSLRRHRGRCPSCGYSLAGLAPAAPCPECGATTVKR